MTSNAQAEQPWFLRYSYPVLFPSHEALGFSETDFESFVRREIADRFHDAGLTETSTSELDKSDTYTLVTDSTAADIRHGMAGLEVENEKKEVESEMTGSGDGEKKSFVTMLKDFEPEASSAAKPNMSGKMLTENADVTHSTSGSALVDLFSELEDVASGTRVRDLLTSAWEADPLMTLKIIFNARSIHLGKSSRVTFYRCAGWLAQEHPATLIANLPWLTRPVIEKKGKKDPEDEDLVMLETIAADDDPLKFDVKHGVAHGYWKDLLNLVALAANDQLNSISNPAVVLNPDNPPYFTAKNKPKPKRSKTSQRGRGSKRVRGSARGGAMGRTRGKCQLCQDIASFARTKSFAESGGDDQLDTEPEELDATMKGTPQELGNKSVREFKRDKAKRLFKEDAVYRSLHLSVARLFVSQLESDLRKLRGTDEKAKRDISLCGKWAPSHDRFHDRQTFIVTTIAEKLHPRESFDAVLAPTDTRETYLRYAREEYRKDISALRKHLDVVERKLSAKQLGEIKYDRLPSLAMHNYAPLFIEKDYERFGKYLDQVAAGKAKISGATLIPSVLVKKARTDTTTLSEAQIKRAGPAVIVREKIRAMEAKVMDGQWNSLVQRIKDSGTLSSSIAIADVSGSMFGPVFPDETVPVDTAVGLALLVAEVTEPPFGGSFITFHSRPKVMSVDLASSFSEKVAKICASPWGWSTDFVAVFEKLILPMAIKNKVKQEDMVKRIFVFSDMQFNEASEAEDRWSTSVERIKDKYAKAGYELPELIFWNLAGGRAGYDSSDDGSDDGNPIAPKAVTVTEEGASLVSGYSQGLLKVFLDSGSFEEPEEDIMEVEVGEDGEVSEKTVKAKRNPLDTVKKAVSHKAYDMLKVVD